MKLHHTNEAAAEILFSHVLDSHHAITGTCYFDKKVAETILAEAIVGAYRKKRERIFLGDVVEALESMQFSHESIEILAAKLAYILSKVNPQAKVDGYGFFSEELEAHFKKSN